MRLLRRPPNVWRTPRKDITKILVNSLLLKRNPYSNKADFGHVLIIAGSKGLSGAAVLCGNACTRSGAGLVTLGTPASQQPIIAKNSLQEVMTLALKETKEKTLSFLAFRQINNYILSRKVTCLALGPGLSQNLSTKKLVRRILKTVKKPAVVDADGLNALSNNFFGSKSDIIITPHPGELSRLVNLPIKEILANPYIISVEFSRKNKVICVLKGHNTIITDGSQVFVNTTGNAGMSKGGSGDVLTGMISALISQVNGSSLKEKLLNACIAGVYLHGLSGDISAKEKTEISMLPSDLIENISKAVTSLRSLRGT